MEQPINILIVDDEPKNLTVLESILDSPGYRLVRADSADKALLALLDEEFALLILDISMPGMTGFELAQMIKERKKTALVPIIFLTAYYNDDQHVIEGYDTGAVDFLHKPVNATVLRSKVAVFADLHRIQRESAVVNRALLAEMKERRNAEISLKELNEVLEQRVIERTEALHELTAKLTEADRHKDEFLALLAHELRNPLAPIRYGVQLMRRSENAGESGGSVDDKVLDMLERQLGQMVRLVDDLLDNSRISQGKLTLQKQRIELATVLSEAVETSRPHINAGGHQLTVVMPPDPVFIEADGTRLAQVFSNLLNNSAKFTAPGGRIQLAAEVRGHDIVVSIKDTGVGISSEKLPRIFEMFMQADHSLEKTHGGLGIGLTLVKKLVEMHGGAVEAKSEGHGKGSEFVVRLPGAVLQALKTPPAKNKSVLSADDTSDRSSDGLRILVADDNQDAANALATLLKIMGYQVRTANDGLQAVAEATESLPDVILMDIGMPRLNGYDACRRIRELAGGENVFLIALTGWGQDEDKQRSKEAGFNRHMLKPIDIAALQKLLSEASPSNKERPAGYHLNS
ncbi:MAG TPA: response regulator [Dongiaceae bacterium]|nr:response regulator [Dongiaceae bacterium]